MILRETPFPRVSPFPLSLAVHPDGVRVASGQTAGVDKDGKVSSGTLCRQDKTPAQLSCTALTASPPLAPAACGSHLGLRDPPEAAGDWTGGLRAWCGGSGLFSSGELAPKKPPDPYFLPRDSTLLLHQEPSEVLAFLSPAQPVLLRKGHMSTSVLLLCNSTPA